jgi:hypothetical protein
VYDICYAWKITDNGQRHGETIKLHGAIHVKKKDIFNDDGWFLMTLNNYKHLVPWMTTLELLILSKNGWLLPVGFDVVGLLAIVHFG